MRDGWVSSLYVSRSIFLFVAFMIFRELVWVLCVLFLICEILGLVVSMLLKCYINKI